MKFNLLLLVLAHYQCAVLNAPAGESAVDVNAAPAQNVDPNASTAQSVDPNAAATQSGEETTIGPDGQVQPKTLGLVLPLIDWALGGNYYHNHGKDKGSTTNYYSSNYYGYGDGGYYGSGGYYGGAGGYYGTGGYYGGNGGYYGSGSGGYYGGGSYYGGY